MLRALPIALATWFGGLVVAQSPLEDVVKTFAPFDLDGDGRAEVRDLEWCDERGKAGRPLVVVLVESRLLRAEGLRRETLRLPVLQCVRDISEEGQHVLMLAVDFHSGPPHQDGRTVLAIRRLFQRLHAVAPMQAAVLVGHFPDAMLVRTCNWRRNEVLTLPSRYGKPVAIDASTTNVRAVPEVVAHRCDLVLADLDGDWERCYVPGPSTLRSAWASFGASVPDRGGVCKALQIGEVPVTDVFHVRDGAAIADPRTFTLRLDADDRDHEVGAVDRTRGNPLARPEIAVSRIDARGLAWQASGELYYALPEKSTRVVFGSEAQQLYGEPRWRRLDRLEVTMLVDYLERNHRFRTEPIGAPRFRPASIAHELGSGFPALRAADPAWADFAEPGYDVYTGADLIELFRWLQRPAVLRTIRAHSDPWGAAFAASDPDALQRELGLPYHGVKDGERFVSSWRDHRGGRADHVFWRAVGAKEGMGGPFLLLHTGCEALSPPRSDLPYDDPEYGKFGHAESILFFTECVAMLGRAKVFYDEPREFAEVLGKGGTIGCAWKRYFELESQATNWDEVGGDIGRKRAYFWSIVGDCTLRLPKPAGR